MRPDDFGIGVLFGAIARYATAGHGALGGARSPSAPTVPPPLPERGVARADLVEVDVRHDARTTEQAHQALGSSGGGAAPGRSNVFLPHPRAFPVARHRFVTGPIYDSPL